MLVVLDEGWEDEIPDKQDDGDDSYRITSHDIYLEKAWKQRHQPDEEDR